VLSFVNIFAPLAQKTAQKKAQFYLLKRQTPFNAAYLPDKGGLKSL